MQESNTLVAQTDLYLVEEDVPVFLTSICVEAPVAPRDHSDGHYLCLVRDLTTGETFRGRGEDSLTALANGVMVAFARIVNYSRRYGNKLHTTSTDSPSVYLPDFDEDGSYAERMLKDLASYISHTKLESD